MSTPPSSLGGANRSTSGTPGVQMNMHGPSSQESGRGSSSSPVAPTMGTTTGTTSTSVGMAVAGPAEVETTIQRLSQHRNVRGVIILSREGVVIRSSGPIFQGADGHVILRRYASEARKIVDAVAASVDHIELEDQLRFLRIRTQLHELLITPDSKFTMVVIQDPTK
ncbi:hypothetical protein PCANC_25474 [Puccinia coronata f. sp. avenae]|uniref:Roadblock/LAMTOR2 domain-containing protein n=1 Tax=Puccinia coronata f. sp. avenae TaxID=200324 RepID=A0A2N5S1L9_9BASI|nr:hypothetical protein PCANC_24848 [Puccinia coronata f. sp. avenae]PLW25136.1 hypothetical protein PCANC_25474 [Puccinia coronata f. sp. avenae]